MATTRFEIEDHTTRCLSGLAVYQEHLSGGRFISGMRSAVGRPYYQGGADPMGEGWVAPFKGFFPIEAFSLEIDGISLHNHWNWLGASSEECGGLTHGVVELGHALSPVNVTVHSNMDGTGFIERWLEVTNTSDKTLALSSVEPMRGLLWRLNDRREHQLDEQFSLAVLPCVPWGYEGTLEWRALKPGVTAFNSYYGRSGWGVPWFMVKNNISGEIIAGHLEWSANWHMSFELVEFPGENDTLLMFSIGPGERSPLRLIEPAETVPSPRVHLGHFTGGLDNAIQRTHRHVRAVSRPLDETNLYIGAARIVDGELDWLEKEVKLAANFGMEYFLVDAGWYGNWAANWYMSTGDWQVTRFDGTMNPVRELIHGHGMRFGLWMEPESMGSASELQKHHPDWAVRRDGSPADPEGRVLDLSRPEVAEFVENAIKSLFDEHKADFFKIDYNTAVREHGENIRGGAREGTAWRYVDALYAIFDRLAQNYPDVFLENCAGGGGRLDLGLFRRCHVSCLSDYTVFPRGIKMLNNMSMALPPERLRVYYRHLPSYHMYGPLETQLNLLMFCNPLFVGFGRDESWLNADEGAVVRRYIGLYKDFIRPVLAGCDSYHHTPGLSFENTEPWCVLEHTSPGGRAGYAGVFKFFDGCDTYTLRFRGVNKSVTYTLTYMSTGERVTMQGVALSAGLPVTLDGALSSEFLLYEKVEYSHST